MRPAEPDPRDVEELERHHVKVKRAKPKPKPKPPAPVPASWRLPGPVILDGSSDQSQHLDPSTGKPFAGIGSVGVIWVPGVCPLWRVTPVLGDGIGWVAQIEGQDQVATAIGFLTAYPKPGDSVAVVTTGNLPRAEAADLVAAAGCDSAFIEVNAQALPDASGECDAQLAQIRNDGYRKTSLSFGVYDGIPYSHYRAECDAKGITPQLEELGVMIFSAAGMTNTSSWPSLR